MIDNNGYRKNIGIILCNINGQVFLAKKSKKNYWQFPQGGIKFGENEKQAMYRELFEEVGLKQKDIRVLSFTNKWISYNIPSKFIRWKKKPLCIGQKQKWFLLQITCSDKKINIKNIKSPEFDDWSWVSFWYPIRIITSFKKAVYRKIMKKFFSVMI